jgi:hypothetical protein
MLKVVYKFYNRVDRLFPRDAIHDAIKYNNHEWFMSMQKQWGSEYLPTTAECYCDDEPDKKVTVDITKGSNFKRITDCIESSYSD